MYDVITIGSATQDAFLVSKKFRTIHSDQFATGVAECISFGSKIELDQFVLTTGGGGTNSAATFASLGFKTAVATRIGNDGPGDAVLKDLLAFKVSTALVKIVKGGETGFSALLTATSGERSVLVHRGVSGDFNEKDLTFSKLNCRLIYLTSLGGNTALALKITRQQSPRLTTQYA